MKNLVKTLLILSLAGFSSISNAGQPTLFSEKGYPYRDLIQRSQEVKIIFSKDAQVVNCKVAVTGSNIAWQSTNTEVSAKAFEQAPLASCLTRDDAKNLLAKTYAS